MARINSNLGSLNAIQNFARVNQELNQVIARLSSGQAINSAADNPAGLIISEQLRGAIEGLSARIQSAERTGNALTTAEDALGQISNILVDVRANTVALANDAALPPEARQALQSQVDMSLEAINRIAASTEFEGRPLLNGEFTAAIGDAEIQVGLVNAANIGGENPDETLATIGTGGVRQRQRKLSTRPSGTSPSGAARSALSSRSRSGRRSRSFRWPWKTSRRRTAPSATPTSRSKAPTSRGYSCCRTAPAASPRRPIRPTKPCLDSWAADRRGRSRPDPGRSAWR